MADVTTRMLSLLRQCGELEVVGDVQLRAAAPDQLFAWSQLLPQPVILAWRGTATGRRHLQLDAICREGPVRGRVTVVLDGDRHRRLWDTLLAHDLACGDEQLLDVAVLQGMAGSTLPHAAYATGADAPTADLMLG